MDHMLNVISAKGDSQGVIVPTNSQRRGTNTSRNASRKIVHADLVPLLESAEMCQFHKLWGGGVRTDLCERPHLEIQELELKIEIKETYRVFRWLSSTSIVTDWYGLVGECTPLPIIAVVIVDPS